jgi:hypothetical protein
MNIVNDDLRHPAVKALLAEHMRGMVEHCPPGSIHSLDLGPPGSIHSLDLDGLRSPDVSFWTARFVPEVWVRVLRAVPRIRARSIQPLYDPAPELAFR